MKKLVLTIILLSFLQGCMYYYKVQTVKPVQFNDIKLYDSLNKYLILHYGDSAWHIYGLEFTANALSGKISDLPENHLKFKTTKTDRGNRYHKDFDSNESNVLEEVHLYLQDSLFSEINVNDSIKIDFSTISKAEVYKKAKGRTLSSWLVPIFGVPIIATGILTIIVVITISNGKFVDL